MDIRVTLLCLICHVLEETIHCRLGFVTVTKTYAICEVTHPVTCRVLWGMSNVRGKPKKGAERGDRTSPHQVGSWIPIVPGLVCQNLHNGTPLFRAK